MLTFTFASDVPYPPDEVMRRLSGGALVDSRWIVADSGRDLYLNPDHPHDGTPGRVMTTSTHLRVEDLGTGSRLTMHIAFNLTGPMKYLLRPWVRRRVAAVFSGLLYAVETGDLRRMNQRRVLAVHQLRVQTATLCFLLFMGALVAVFVAFLSWILAGAIAAGYVLVAYRPVHRIRVARRILRNETASPLVEPNDQRL